MRGETARLRRREKRARGEEEGRGREKGGASFRKPCQTFLTQVFQGKMKEGMMTKWAAGGERERKQGHTRIRKEKRKVWEERTMLESKQEEGEGRAK